jgi:hypothetical protein
MNENQLSLAFPLPPTYYQNYTEENQRKWEEKDATCPELGPPQPIEGPFTVFGQIDDVYKIHIDRHEVSVP